MTTLEHKRNIEKNLLKLSTFIPHTKMMRDEVGSVVMNDNGQPVYLQVGDNNMMKAVFDTIQSMYDYICHLETYNPFLGLEHKR